MAQPMFPLGLWKVDRCNRGADDAGFDVVTVSVTVFAVVEPPACVDGVDFDPPPHPATQSTAQMARALVTRTAVAGTVSP